MIWGMVIWAVTVRRIVKPLTWMNWQRAGSDSPTGIQTPHSVCLTALGGERSVIRLPHHFEQTI